MFYNRDEVSIMDIQSYWDAVIRQDPEAMILFFKEDAVIRWHNTNECFTVLEFLRANCEYPGQWWGTVERIVQQDDLIVTVTHVYNEEETVSHHAVSFFTVQEDEIAAVDEYWGEDGVAPQWRQMMRIGCPIRKG